MLVRKAGSQRGKARPLFAFGVTVTAQSMLPFGIEASFAQQADVASKIIERMAKEKEARRACKVEICSAFAKPSAGAPITCEATKTWPRPEITAKIVGGSYVWGYGHMQCSVKLTLDRGHIAKAISEAKATVAFPEHAFACVVDDKEPAKGQAFTVSFRITPVVGFESGQAKSVKLEPVKTEGSTLASAAVASIMAVDKVSGFVSRTLAAEINNFLYERCKEDGIEIARH
jgi:hypothetical protein